MFNQCVARSQHYSEEELKSVQQSSIPRHVAIIPDGNRRWAKQQSDFSLMIGHWAGAVVFSTILEAAFDLGVKVLTVYGFSTENWLRSPREVKTLLKILEAYLRENRQKMVDMGVCFEVIGDLTPFSHTIKNEIDKTREMTCEGDAIDLVLAINYGARDEMRRAFVSLVHDFEMGKFNKEQITEEMIAHYLDTEPYGDPELLIRAGGEKRVSNFLLWQLAYTEVYTTDILWPEFTPRDLLNAVLDFQKRTRRLGK